MEKAKITVVGSSNIDMIAKVGHLPLPGETVGEGEFATVNGGKGANQAVGAARAGGAVTFVSHLGDDIFAGKAIDSYLADGIDVRYIRRVPGVATGVALITIDKAGENCIAVAPGANYTLDPEAVRQARPGIETAAMVVLQLEIPLASVEEAIRIAKEAGVKVLLNPAPAKALPDTLISKIDVLVVNETEAAMLSGMQVESDGEVIAAGEKLLAKGPEMVIITLGSKGSAVFEQGRYERVPSFKVKAVDTTAAGDVYCGTLSVALSEGNPLKEAVRRASAAAAISVTRLGAQPSAPTRDEIDAFLASQT